MNKKERVELLKETIDNCLFLFEQDEPEMDDFCNYSSCGLKLEEAKDELKEILSSEEYEQLDEKYTWKFKK